MNLDDDHTLVPGHDNTQMLGLDFHNPVFPLSALAIIAFILYALVYPDAANIQLTAARNWSIEYFDWLFMIAGNLFVILCLVLIVPSLQAVADLARHYQAEVCYAAPQPARQGAWLKLPRST